jgi:transposase
MYSCVELLQQKMFLKQNKSQQNNPRNHIKGIENFWGVAKVRLSKLRGLQKDHFNLRLKEFEFCCNMRSEDMYEKLLEILRDHAKIQPERINRITKNQLLKLS